MSDHAGTFEGRPAASVSGAPRALDHIVWPARNLDALAETFRRLGFTVGRRNRHPWGTVNHIIQFDGCFLELLGFAEDYRSVPFDDPAHPFAGFCERFLTGTAEGAAMLVLRSDDAEADAHAFRAEGIGQGRLLPFSRAAQGPDGSDRSVSFTVAFAELPGLPEIGAFVCQHHRPENFWNPAVQIHPNGATGIRSVTLSVPDPQAHRRSLQLFAGRPEGADPTNRDMVPLASGEIALVPSAGAARLSALGLTVADLPRLRQVLDAAGVAFTGTDALVRIAAAAAGGTDLVFGAPSSVLEPARRA